MRKLVYFQTLSQQKHALQKNGPRRPRGKGRPALRAAPGPPFGVLMPGRRRGARLHFAPWPLAGAKAMALRGRFARHAGPGKKKSGRFAKQPLCLEVPTRFELVHRGFADLCLTAWLRHHKTLAPQLKLQRQIFMERITRLELATSTLARWRSTR